MKTFLLIKFSIFAHFLESGTHVAALTLASTMRQIATGGWGYRPHKPVTSTANVAAVAAHFGLDNVDDGQQRRRRRHDGFPTKVTEDYYRLPGTHEAAQVEESYIS